MFVSICFVLLGLLMAFCLWCHLIQRKVVSLRGSIKNRRKKCCRGICEFLVGTSRHMVIHNMDYEQHQEGAFDDNFQMFPANQELQAFIDKTEINKFYSAIFAEGRDCPLCFKPFRDINQVIQLKCNKLHLYHEQCLLEMLKFTCIEKNCLIC